MKADTETVDVRPRLHFELFDLHLAAVIDDGDVLDERLGRRMRGEGGFVTPCLAD